MYLYNIRTAFKGAFLPKVNCPKDFKQIRYPEGYNSDNFKKAFQDILKNYAQKNLETTSKDGEFQQNKPKSLAKILGYEVLTGSVVTENKSNDESKKLNNN